METKTIDQEIQTIIDDLNALAKSFTNGWERIEEEADKIRKEADDRYRKQIKLLKQQMKENRNVIR